MSGVYQPRRASTQPRVRTTMEVVLRSERLVLALLLTACRPAARAPTTPPTAAPPPGPFDTLPYASAPLPTTAKVFVVAGGDDIANFAADMLEQRQLWLDAGLQPDEVACYYAKPTDQALQSDRQQYEQLAPDLAPCYPATPKTLHAHLRQAAASAPPYLYLFVTSHGLPPLLRWSADVEGPNALPEHLDLRPGEIGRFDRHTIGLQAGDTPPLGDVEGVLAAHRAGTPTENLVLNPATLADALAPLPADSPAIVVLQACFSGGFIARPQDDGGHSELTERPHTTIMTASSAARPSFGCGAGARHTYFGGAFNRVLAKTLGDAVASPAQVPWPDVFSQIRFVVETMEDIEGERPSQPRLFHEGQDYGAEVEVGAAADEQDTTDE